MKRTKCTNCGMEHDGKFCPNCATPAKKKKKFLVPVIIIVVLLVLIAGMGGDEEPEQPVSVKGDVTVATEAGQEAAQQQPVTQPKTESREVTIRETELYNNGGIVVTATELTDGFFGPEIKVTVSNDTQKNVIISSRELSVNGYMLPASSLYCDVAAGKKAVETLTLMRSEMDAAGIDTVAEVAFWLHIYDADTYDGLDDSDLITITTSAGADFVQPVDDSGDVIYENKDIRVICKGLKKDLIWDGTVVFYVENNRGETINVYTENVSVNGFMVDESMWTELRAGTRCIDGMYLLSMEDQGIESLEDVKTIEFNLRIIDGDWDEIDTSDVITLNFE